MRDEVGGEGRRRHARLPGPAQGLAGGRRARHPDRLGRRQPGDGRADLPERGGGGVRILRDLPGEVRGGRPPRRGADPGRRPRPHHPPGRAGLLHPAPAPEAPGGDAVPGARGRDAPGADRRGAPSLPGGGLRERGHGRVPARPAGPLLLPRGQHAHPGRASGDRDGDGHRPRPRADPDRRGGAAGAPPGGRRLPGARDRVPGHGRGPGHLHAQPGPRHRLCPARRARRARGQPLLRRVHGAARTTTRWSRRSSPTARTARTRWPACGGRWRSSSWRESGRPCRCTRAFSPIRGSIAGDYSTTFLESGSDRPAGRRWRC